MQTEGKVKINNKKRVIRSRHVISCHVTSGLSVTPTSLACPVVVLSCSACFVFRRTEFQGHLRQLRHAVV